MIAVDTNLLVYAHRRDQAWYEPARAVMAELFGRPAVWGLPWPCVFEFLSVVTNARIWPKDPTPLEQALDQIQAWLEGGNVRLLSEQPDMWPAVREVLAGVKLTGHRVHDAKIAAICLSQGVHELWTADRDFSRFGRLKTRNPLATAARLPGEGPGRPLRSQSRPVEGLGEDVGVVEARGVQESLQA